ncbi:DUF305 domain-containing protein [Candidatus Raskinella chloraquaticus]|jgi:uncharacterized protein (DUF305 family)|uniref:DUF305 domain-containing protein n=2 Tax=Candidatus Raskinella chloraquaticus TaxID=1951219 RepID=A0A1W9I5I6_9HYPH|nr:MAG: DUF305 domain-containing protein [Proteobacteria bacterium SG_bin8]
MKLPLTLAIVAILGLSGLASAQHSGHQTAPAANPHAGHGAAAPDNSPASKAFRQANDKMHAEMNVPLTGNADVDFARGMIPHHQGAIDMAKIVLTYGKDPELRKLAEAVIAAQDSEIAFMKAWLAKNGK